MTSASWRTRGDTSPVSKDVATVTGSVNSSQIAAEATTAARAPTTTPIPTTRSIPSRVSTGVSEGDTGRPSVQAYIWTGRSWGSPKLSVCNDSVTTAASPTTSAVSRPGSRYCAATRITSPLVTAVTVGTKSEK